MDTHRGGSASTLDGPPSGFRVVVGHEGRGVVKDHLLKNRGILMV